mmetsp:Transcript_27357/g.27591  ORF Transcript_27357/g.27591 Transcript_27357/m.27591 type:complete len:393 (+) Transcript_27357:41-1219(+)
MEAHTTLVHVNVDTALKLVSFVSNLLPKESSESFSTQCDELIQLEKPYDLLKLLVSNVDVIVSCDNEKDAEGCILAFVTILVTVESDEDNTSIITSLTQALTSNTKTKAKLRLRILTSLFNVLTLFSSKLDVLKAIFLYAGSTDQSSSLSRFQLYIETWADSWCTSVTQKRELYKLVADVLSKENKTSLPLSFLVKYLDSYAGEELPSDVIQIATKAVVTAIESAISSFSDRISLMECLSKHQLQDTDLKILFELLRIVCADTLETYSSFESNPTNKSILVKYNISSTELKNEMKLLSLCSLAASDATLTYSKIAKTLSISEDQVEACVVEAISLSLIDATMDQCTGTVSVSRCVHRSFGATQWKQLRSKLQLWRKNVVSAMDTLQRHGNLA